MTARRTTAGRNNGKRVVASIVLAIATSAMLLSTELPAGFPPAGGGSAALAEIAARSPGPRIGGVALKAKSIGALMAPGPVAAAPAPGNAVASVLGTSAGPEGAVPGSGAVGPGGFPSDFLTPAAPAEAGSPGVVSSPPTGDFGSVALPPVGGLPIFVPGGGGGGGGGELAPPPGGGVVVPPGPGGAIPEPSTWLMLIGGFGMIGHAMRRGRQARLA